MRLPKNSVQKIEKFEGEPIKGSLDTVAGTMSLTVALSEFAGMEPYSDVDLENPHELEKFIKRIEKIIRGSDEYRNFIKYLKEEKKMTKSSVMPGIDMEDIKGRSIIEFHHFPFSLFDIVFTVISSKLAVNPKIFLNPFGLCDEVMRLHYEGKVGLVPLDDTSHELYHSGNLLLDVDQVTGDYEAFAEEYILGMNDTTSAILRRIESVSEEIKKNPKLGLESLEPIMTFILHKDVMSIEDSIKLLAEANNK